MSSSLHSRNGSNTSQSSTASGSSYQVIYDHIMSYPGTYDIPLRRMYELNCAPRTIPATAPSSAGNSPTTATFHWMDYQARAAQFAVSLSQQISQLPSQPSSLPPSFVSGFVRKCFPHELGLVDFPHALAALDYMKDLEMRRRRELANSIGRLGINESTVEGSAVTDNISAKDPRIADWIKNLEVKERKVDSLYTQCYIALRRWIMINEMSLTPFNKHSCIAMLNTLYPPVLPTAPTRKLTQTILNSQREGFFKYIQTVEKRGVGVLKNLMNQGKREGEDNGWAAVHRFVLQYLNMAISIINECEDVNVIELDARPHLPTASPQQQQPSVTSDEEVDKRKGRKVDSGVSFEAAQGKHSKNSSTSSTSSFSLPASQTPSLGKGGSTLERIAREFRKIRSRPRLDVYEPLKGEPAKPFAVDDINKENPPSPTKGRGISGGLRKMRSLGALSDLKHGNGSAMSLKEGALGSQAPAFDADAMRKQREAFEQRVRLGALV